jgi:glucose/arabinose dehydrogenase
MLRIDVDKGDPYGIPAGNPFAAAPDVRPEIYMTGLRNPWRWSFDRDTGDLWIADVGEDKREEVTMIPRATQAGTNLGWPMLEGSLCFRPPEGCDRAGLLLPTLEYEHPTGCSVTGGYVYRGRMIPRLRGTYFYADYCTGWVKSFRLDAAGKPAEEMTWESFPKEDAVASFGEDAAGEIYIVMSSGRIYRIEPAAGP